MMGAPVPDRRGDWMQLAGGGIFWPLDPRADEIRIEDIAASLSKQCRYAGHTKTFYSVGQHSVLISRTVPPEDALWGLLHDASEAYLVDVPSPVKPFISGYKAMEAYVMAVVCDRFGLQHGMPASVHEMDKRILANEKRDLMGPCVRSWGEHLVPIAGMTIKPWSPAVSERRFLQAFRTLSATT